MSIPLNNRETNRWSISTRAAELWGGDNKPDMLDIRAVTAAEKSINGKRQKYRKNVHKKGAFIYGSKPCPNDGREANDNKFEKLFINDPRAPSMKIDYKDKNFYCLPSIERFSAHTGICEVVGSRTVKGEYHKLRVGDIIRFGSVGFLVSEIDTNEEGPWDGAMTQDEINHMVQRVVCQDEEVQDVNGAIDSDDEINDDPDKDDNKKIDDRANNTIIRSSMHNTALCYVCYEASSDKDPLIAPCKCSGDTKYIHLNCLKKWNTSSDKNDVCTILDESEARKCTVCQTAYPPKTKLPSGQSVSLLPDRLPAPSLVLILITKHSASSLATNTRYQLSMSTLLKTVPKRPLRIGRSSQCDLVLKYRTVSTVHAEMIYTKGEFYLSDLSSSNGTLRYIYKPFMLESGKTVNLKFGRTIVTFKVTKKIRLPALLAQMMTVRSGSTFNTEERDFDPESENHQINDPIIRSQYLLASSVPRSPRLMTGYNTIHTTGDIFHPTEMNISDLQNVSIASPSHLIESTDTVIPTNTFFRITDQPNMDIIGDSNTNITSPPPAQS